jgi:hypothetical protein
MDRASNAQISAVQERCQEIKRSAINSKAAHFVRPQCLLYLWGQPTELVAISKAIAIILNFHTVPRSIAPEALRSSIPNSTEIVGVSFVPRNSIPCKTHYLRQ